MQSAFTPGWAAVAIAALLLGGCGGDDAPTPEQTADESPRMIEREAPDSDRRSTDRAQVQQSQQDFRVMPDIEGSREQEGMGLETVINAGSKEDYAQSLKWIAEDTSREQFDRLETSIRFIHMYDADVYGSEEALHEKLDGMTGSEVIAYADELIEKRRAQREQQVQNLKVPEQGDG